VTVTREDLIRHLDKIYGGNAPVFAVQQFDGTPLETGREMKELYEEIVGKKNPTPGAWVRCPHCLGWSIDSGLSTDPGDSLTP
jgi:hypothetical protein